MYRELLVQQAALASDNGTTYADSGGFTLPELNFAVSLLNERHKKIADAHAKAASRVRST